MSFYDSDEYDYVESEFSEALPSHRQFEAAIVFDLDECKTTKYLKGKRVEIIARNESAILNYATLKFPEKCARVITYAPEQAYSTDIAFVVLSTITHVAENLFIIPNKTFEDMNSARYDYCISEYDYHCFLLPRELSSENYIRNLRFEGKTEKDTMIVSVHPDDVDSKSGLSFLSYEGLNVCYLAYVYRKLILVKLRYHISPMVKEKSYLKCFTSDNVSKIVQFFKKHNSSQLQVKLSVKSQVLEEQKSIGTYQSLISSSHQYGILSAIGGRSHQVLKTLNVTAHLVTKAHIPTILEKGNGHKCIVFIDKNGSTESMRHAIAKLIHKNPASFRIQIENFNILELESLKNVSFLKQFSVLRTSAQPTISLSCMRTGGNMRPFDIDVYPYPSKTHICTRVSEKLQLNSFYFDLYHGNEPMPEILSEKDLFQTNTILIDVKRRRKMVKYFISSALHTEGIERKGNMVIDDYSETQMADVLRLFSAYLNVDAAGLRLIVSGRCPNSNRTLKDIGLSESSTIIITSCSSFLFNDRHITTQITADARGILTLTESLMIEGIPVVVHPSFSIASYKERLQARATKKEEKRAIVSSCKGMRILGRMSPLPQSDEQNHSMVLEESQKEDVRLFERRISDGDKQILLQKARRLRSRIAKSDGEYSDRDTKSETTSVKDIPTNGPLKSIRQSRSENDIKDMNRRKGKVSFSEIEDTETKQKTEPISKDFPDYNIPIPQHNPVAINKASDLPFDEVQILQSETREKMVFKQGTSVLQRETLVCNKVLSSSELSLTGIGVPVITEVPEDCAETSALQNIARQIGKDWKNVGRNLNMKESDFENIESNFKGLYEVAYQMLLTWKKKHGSFATKDVLVEALKNSDRSDIAEFVMDSL